MSERYLEDFAVGQTFGSGRLRISVEQIKAFAAEFDPQPFHLNEEAAQDTIFQGLAASGWHTAALTMRLLVESELKPAGGLVGAGFDGGCTILRGQAARDARPRRPSARVRLVGHSGGLLVRVRLAWNRSRKGSVGYTP